MTETIEKTRRRLIFRSSHRGTKEMDLITGSFAAQHLPTFTAERLAQYNLILDQNDPDLYSWLIKKNAPPETIARLPVFELLMAHRFV